MRVGVEAVWLCAVLAPVGCTIIPEDPTKEDAAAYFGLAAGRELVFEVQDGTTTTSAKHAFAANETFAGRLAFSRVERNAANIVVGTEVLEADLEQMRLLRTGDCVPDCTDYATPPVLLTKPIDPGATVETQTDTTVTSRTGTAAGPRQRHSVTFSDLADVATPAGTFKAHPVLWKVLVDGQATATRELYFAPDRGFVQIKQGSATYKLKSGVSP